MKAKCYVVDIPKAEILTKLINGKGHVKRYGGQRFVHGTERGRSVAGGALAG